METSITSFWRERNRIIAGAAILLVALHLLLRFVLQAQKEVFEFPLQLLLLVGGLPLLYELVLKIAEREFSADFLAGISIAAASVAGMFRKTRAPA